MRRTRRKIIGYGLLLTVAAVLLFPFYWVLVSSVKSIEGLSMTPPSFYPSVYRKADVTLPAHNRLVAAEGQRWFQLIASPNLLEKTTASGGYYVRLDENDAPSQLVAWFPDSIVSSVENPDSLRFTSVPVHHWEEANQPIRIAAKMVRPRAEGGGFDELLFATVDDAPLPEVRVLHNVTHSEIRDFSARWANYPETLRGPEAAMGAEESTGFLVFMRNSFFISILAVLGQIFSSSLVAFAFARLSFRGRDGLFILLLATMMIPGQVTLIPLFSIYKSLGWIDTFLPLIVPHFTAGAFNVFLLRQYMLTLPKELDDSAAMDGCGPFRTYFYVILPNCIPVLIVVGLFTFVATWQDVMGPLIYLDNPDYRTVTLGLEYFRSPYVDTRHLLMTGAVLAMLPVAILFLIFQRYIVSGIATTGLKT